MPSYFNCVLTSATIISLVLVQSPLKAQILPDATLPSNSMVTLDGNTLIINGGTTRGSNLFHSFESFSLPTNIEAFFNNPGLIENIITRITGNSISNIDGLIRANGTANLFLLNPNGINFGPNASLNIGGSFISSTANRIEFADGTEFSATNPSVSPLLTVSVPIGLQVGENSGAIRVQGQGHSLTGGGIRKPVSGGGQSSTGLQVKPGNTLALVGRNIIFDSGIVTAPQGQIELGSVDSGVVSLKPTTKGWTLSYEGVQSFRDIELSQQSLVDASGMGSSSIQIQGANVSVTDGSAILLQNQGIEPGGNITINASESLEVSGDKPDGSFPSVVSNEVLGLGDGGDVIVSSKKLILRNGGVIDATTFAPGAQGGNVEINTADSLEIIGFSSIEPKNFSAIGTSTLTSGNSGNVNVSTAKLTILDGGLIASSTIDSTGSGGDVIINATESIELAGANPFNSTPSALGSTTLSDRGNAGSLTINTAKLVVRDGARVDAGTQAAGSAATLIINATESIEIKGKGAEVAIPTVVGSQALIEREELQETFEIGPIPSGNSGNVILNTPKLTVTDGAQVTVRNDGTGDAGTLRVNADSIFLNNQGGITASTASGEGGDIALNVQDTLLLRHNSFISTTAGGTGNGGNIDINAKFIVAVPRENSDITANAFEGRGGNVKITTQGIFGLEPQEKLTPLSDITASSELGVEGVIEINISEIDPTKELLQLPEQVVDVARLIDQNLCAISEGSEFTITGRGGLADSPNQTLNTDNTWEDWRLPESSEPQTESRIIPTSNYSSQKKILEFQGWAVNSRGNIVLTAEANVVTSKGNWLPSPGCQMGAANF